MVKFERPDSSEAHVAIESLKREKRKGSGKYNTNEVNKALGLMFAHKFGQSPNRTSRSTSWKPRFDVRLGKSVFILQSLQQYKKR